MIFCTSNASPISYKLDLYWHDIPFYSCQLLNKNNGCMKNIFTNLYLIAVRSEYLDVFCWFMFVPILSITNYCYSWWFLISTTIVLIRMGVVPMGGGERLVYRSTYCEPAMECAWRNMSMALSWFAYLPLLCSKFLGQGLYIKYQS